MKLFTIREYRDGKVTTQFKPYKQFKRARDMAKIVLNNRLVEKVDILVKKFGENENAGKYEEYVIAI